MKTMNILTRWLGWIGSLFAFVLTTQAQTTPAPYVLPGDDLDHKT